MVLHHFGLTRLSYHARLTEDDCPQPPLPYILPQGHKEDETKDSTPDELLVKVTLQ